MQGRCDGAVRAGVAVFEQGEGGGEQGGRGCSAVAERDGVAFAGGAEVAEKGEAGAVADIHGFGVHDGQGEAGTLKQGGAVAKGRKGGNSGRDAAADGEFGLAEAFAQAGEGRQNGDAGEKEAVGFQGVPDLGEGAGQIVDPVQGEICDDEIETVFAEGKKFLVDADGRRERLTGELRRKIAADDVDAAGAEAGICGAASADIESEREGAGEVVQAFEQAVGGFTEEVCDAAECGGGAVAMQPDGFAVECQMLVLHGEACAPGCALCQGEARWLA